MGVLLQKRSLRFAVVTLAAFAAYAQETGLDRYVHKADPTYQYKVVNTLKGEGYTEYVVDLTSQTWRTPAERPPILFAGRPAPWRDWVSACFCPARPPEGRFASSKIRSLR